ncbi:MAG TPA: efflux RND transporter periplasmic adaptor subunit [Oceanipulchritudo sp.]|nr:efflux RND transporter periplasmic adaptor subunit [Oceanipulchritudo sp.]
MQRNPYTRTALQRIFPVSLVIVCGLVPTGCGRKAPAEAPQVARPVKMVQLVSGGFDTVLALPGKISPLKQADMAFEVPGVMVEMLVSEGEPVEEGQLLARLDPRDYEAMRAAALAQLENAQIEAERAQALYERQATSKQRQDIALSNLKVAQSAFEKADKAYNDTFLRAPISGIVAKKLVEDVVNVQAKQAILIIQDSSQLKAIVDIPETVGAFARVGMSLEERTAYLKPKVTLSFLPDRAFPARISEVSLMADPATRTYQASFLFDPPTDLMILPGMTAKVEITFQRNTHSGLNAFAVPVQAVAFDNQGSAFVWIVDEDMTVHKQQVAAGQVSGTQIEIISEALHEGSRVVTSGVHLLSEGDPVSTFER